MGKISRIIIENFKSYGGRHEIGPLKDFTAIIGPNGAGKSNLMDAISFVFGISSRHLRSANLKELLYTNAQERSSKNNALVELIYQPSDSELSGNHKEIRFTRIINTSGKTTYKYNGKSVSWEVYESHLKSIGVLVKARNFLVFQGDVESIASMSPNDRTKYFEQISGSIELKEEFEEVKELKEEAERLELQNINEKKSTQKVKHQIKEQQKIMEEYLKTQKQLNQLKLDTYLWELYLVKQQLEVYEEKKLDFEKSLVTYCNKEVTVKSHCDDLTKVFEKLKKSKKDLVYILRKIKVKIREQQHEVKKEKESMEFISKKETIVIEDMNSIKTAIKENEKEIKNLKNQVNEIKQSIKQVQQQHKSTKDNKNLPELSEKIQKELEIIRNKFTQSHKDTQETLERKRNNRIALVDATTRLESLVLNAKEHRNDIGITLKVLEDELKVGKEVLKDLKESLKNRSKVRSVLKEKLRTSREDKSILIDETKEISKVVNSISIAKQETSRERRNYDDIQILKRKFSGVYGRLVDLIKPKEDKYGIALTTAIGRKNLQAVICDTLETAKLCSEYLRNCRINSKNFIPLNRIKVKERYAADRERIRHFSTSNAQSFRAAFDIVDYDSKIRSAVEFALGSTVVCKTLADAQYMIYKKKERLKVVTLEGEVISADGSSITAGRVEAGKRNQFELREGEELVRKLAIVDEKISIIDKNITNYEKELEEHNNNASSDIESKIKLQENEIKIKDKQFEQTGKRLKLAQDAENKANENYQESKEKLNTLDKDIKDIEDELQKAEETLIQEFEKKHNISNVKLYEQEYIEKNRKYLERLEELNKQKTRLEGRLNSYVSMDLTSNLKSLEVKHKHLVADKAKATEIYTTAKQKLQTYEKNLKDEQKKEKEIQKEINQTQEELNQANSELKKVKQDKRKAIENKNSIDGDMEALHVDRHRLLSEATLNEVMLPTIKGVSLTELDVSQSRTVMASQTSLESDSQSFSATQESSDGTGVVVQSENFKLGILDFEDFVKRCKTKKFMERFNGKNILKIKERNKQMVRHIFSTEVATFESKLGELKPNLDAKDNLKEVEKELQEKYKTLKESTSARQRLEDRYEELKQQRLERFQVMYNHVSDVIDKIYKDLTRSKVHRFGGNAYMNLEDPDQPWEGGIRYNTTPPSKRYRDMTQLSGGEKTVAALALLFAIHSYHPAPFFVMDEVDAALDNVNVMKVSNYIKRNSTNFQCLVISLKDSFYHKANALVGVYKDREENCSGILTLDLDNYPQ